MTRHIEDEHKYPCSQCEFSTGTYQSLNDHIKETHIIQDEQTNSSPTIKVQLEPNAHEQHTGDISVF